MNTKTIISTIICLGIHTAALASNSLSALERAKIYELIDQMASEYLSNAEGTKIHRHSSTRLTTVERLKIYRLIDRLKAESNELSIDILLRMVRVAPHPVDIVVAEALKEKNDNPKVQQWITEEVVREGSDRALLGFLALNPKSLWARDLIEIGYQSGFSEVVYAAASVAVAGAAESDDNLRRLIKDLRNPDIQGAILYQLKDDKNNHLLEKLPEDIKERVSMERCEQLLQARNR